MSILTKVKRLVRLGGWLGLSVGAMVVEACGSSASPAGGQDGGADAPADHRDVAGPDQSADGGPRDADSDLWNTICE